MADPSGYLPNLLGPVVIAAGGVAQTPRPTINFVGCTGADNPTYDRLDITPPAGGGSSLPVNRPIVEKSANYTLISSTDYQVVFTGAGGYTATLPASPAAGDTYEITNLSSGTVTVAGNGNSILSPIPTSIAYGQTVTYRKSTSANWYGA